MGRIDATEIDQTRLLDFDAPIFSNYERMGFTDQQIAAIMGCHALGKANPDTCGLKGRWTMNPYVFDNEYYKNILMEDKNRYLQTEHDRELVRNARFKGYVEQYAQDQDAFFRDYADAHARMSEGGQVENLMCEIEAAEEQEQLIGVESGLKTV